MKGKLNKKTLGIITLLLLVAILGWWASNSIPRAESSAPTGYATEWATSSIITLQSDSRVMFATSSVCTSRVITTTSTPIRIKFGDHANFTLSGTAGHLQLGSTTVSYDSGLYGCGLWTGVGLSGNTNLDIIVTEFSGFR